MELSFLSLKKVGYYNRNFLLKKNCQGREGVITKKWIKAGFSFFEVELRGYPRFEVFHFSVPLEFSKLFLINNVLYFPNTLLGKDDKDIYDWHFLKSYQSVSFQRQNFLRKKKNVLKLRFLSNKFLHISGTNFSFVPLEGGLDQVRKSYFTQKTVGFLLQKKGSKYFLPRGHLFFSGYFSMGFDFLIFLFKNSMKFLSNLFLRCVNYA